MIRKLSWPPDVTVGVVSGILGVVYLIGATQITPDPSQFNVMGPRVAPVTIGIATVLCSIALIAQGLRTRTRAEASPVAPVGSAPVGSTPDDSGPDEAADRDDLPVVDEPRQERSLARVLVTFGLFTAYIFVFIPLGYVLSTFAFLVALTTYVAPDKWIRNCVFAAVFAAAVYLLFTRGLRVDLPPGLLG